MGLNQLVIMAFLLATIGLCSELAAPEEARAGPPKEKQMPQASRSVPSGPACIGKLQPAKKSPARSVNIPTERSSSGMQRQTKPKAAGKPASVPAGKYHGTFIENLKSTPFPYTGKNIDPNFFDVVDPKTGERFRTTRNLERLSEKDHYRDNSVLFHVPDQFDIRKPFTYIVFFHGNRTEIRQFLKDYRLDEQMNKSMKNAILILPQLARNASDSSPGRFAVKNVFRSFMLEVAQVLTSKFGKNYQKRFEQAPIVLVAFSGGYKPLACTLDRGGVGSRIKGVFLMDALYEDLYIFSKWILRNPCGGFFINLFTEESACEDKTRILAQFLREHHLPYAEEWPKGVKKGQISLVRSSFDHMQIPIAGPPQEPLAKLLQNLRI
jgi:hypothetical protein